MFADVTLIFAFTFIYLSFVSAGKLEKVIVTVQKRDQILQDVSLAVRVFPLRLHNYHYPFAS